MNSFEIKENKGDIIGVNVDGNGNVIGKNISVVINEFSQDCGLTLIPPNHFKDNTNTDENFKDWLDTGYPLSLESIHEGRELKRDKILYEIKDKLEEKKRLLILGESGTSKTILLNEVICEYFDKDYKVLYNTGGDSLKDTNTIIEKIKGLAFADNKVLVVIDNVHSPRVSLIFNVVKNLNSLNEEKRKNIRFLLAARIPEFNWALERNLFNDTHLVQTIETLFDSGEFKLAVKYFDKQEIKAFVEKYYSFMNPLLKNKSLEQNTKDIYDDTKNGNPILVRFAAFNKGLTSHVKQMYREYLLDKNNEGYPHAKRVKTIMLNSLFDISNIPLTDELLEEFGLLSTAKKELKNTIIRKTGDYWETIHPKWDMELFRHMFSLEGSLDDIEKAFKDIVDKMISSQHISSINTLFLLETIYHTIAKQDIVKKNIIEKMMNQVNVENRLDDFSKSFYYATVIGVFYDDTGRYKKAIVEYDKALKIDSNHVIAYNNKGLSLSNLGKYEKAIKEYDKAIKIDENYVNAYYNKGLSLPNLGKYEKAIKEYDKAIKINPYDADTYYNKGWSFAKLGKYEKAIKEYDKALKVNPKYVIAYYNKGWSLSNLGRDKEAIVEYDKALEINPYDADTYYNKGLSLSNVGKEEEAIVEYDKVIELDSNFVIAYYNKGSSLSSLGRDKEAIVEYDKVIELDSNFVNAYINKGSSLSNLGKEEEAIVEYDKVIELDSNFVIAYYNKGSSLSSLGRDKEAIVEYDKVIELDSNFVNAYINKGSSLSNLGKEEEAIVEYDKALDIDSNYVNAFLVKSLSLFSLGQRNEAKLVLNKALEIEPDNQLAQQIKEQFEK